MKSRKKRSASSPQEETQTEIDSLARNKRRKLLLGSLIAGGTFQLGGWSAAAHGNRSSHGAKSIQWAPEDFVALPPGLLDPQSLDSKRLAELSAQIAKLKDAPNLKLLVGKIDSQSIVLNQLLAAKPASAQGIIKEDVPSTPKKLPEEISTFVSSMNETDAGDLRGLLQLMSEKATLENKLETRAKTQQVLNFLINGNSAGAVAVVEGAGDARRVLTDYQFALLDLADLGTENLRYGDSYLQKFVTLGQAAMAYCTTLTDSNALGAPPERRELEVQVAEVLHNIANFTLPDDDGKQSPEALKLGLSAAKRALIIRNELGEVRPTMLANWMLGVQYWRNGQLDDAIRTLKTALSQAESLNDREGIAWCKAYLARAIESSDSVSSKAMLEDARKLANSIISSGNYEVVELRPGVYIPHIDFLFAKLGIAR